MRLVFLRESSGMDENWKLSTSSGFVFHYWSVSLKISWSFNPYHTPLRHELRIGCTTPIWKHDEDWDWEPYDSRLKLHGVRNASSMRRAGLVHFFPSFPMTDFYLEGHASAAAAVIAKLVETNQDHRIEQMVSTQLEVSRAAHVHWIMQSGVHYIKGRYDVCPQVFHLPLDRERRPQTAALYGTRHACDQQPPYLLYEASLTHQGSWKCTTSHAFAWCEHALRRWIRTAWWIHMQVHMSAGIYLVPALS